MFEASQAPLFFGLIAAFVTTLGLLAVAMRSDWSLRYADFFGLAAAGLLATMAFLHIIPKAFALTDDAPIWIAGGFFGGLLLHNVIQSLIPEREGAKLPAVTITPVLAIAAHSFIDGVVYSVTFAASFAAGVFTALGLILHEFPEGVIAFAILRRGGVSNRMSFLFAFLAAAATTPFGVLVSGPFLHQTGESVLGLLFALSAGLLLFVATGPLMAPLKQVPASRGLASIATGIALAVALLFSPITGHDHSHVAHADEHGGGGHSHGDHAEHEHAQHDFRR